MTAHIIYKDIDRIYTVTHSKKIISLIRNKIKFKNLLISDDISMKSLKFPIKLNINKAFNAGCNLVLHCNGKFNEMIIVAKNSPKINDFIIKKTSQFYKNFKLVFRMSSIDSYQFNVNLNTFKGPLDVLLDLAKSQKVNLENIFCD